MEPLWRDAVGITQGDMGKALRVAPSMLQVYERLCRSLGLTACAPYFSPPGRESSSWGVLARATLTEKLQSSSNAQ